MFLKHLVLGLVFGISLSFISWVVAIIVNSIFMKTKYYKKLSNLNFIPGKTLNQKIGINHFRWIVKNTFFKFFNPNIKVNHKQTDLTELRNQMTYSEISHLIGFIFVATFAIYFTFKVSLVYGLSIMIANIFMNLYPSLLQQENKRRIDRFIKRQIKTP